MHQIYQRRRSRYCVTYTCHSLICFSTCCHTLDTLPYCVTYTWHSLLYFATEEDVFTVSAILDQVHIKKPGRYRKKMTSSRHLLPVKLFKILATHLQNSPIHKKNLANTPADLKKRNRKRKNDGIVALSTI